MNFITLKTLKLSIILIILVGVFGFAVNVNTVQAAECTSPNTPVGCTPPPGQCWRVDQTPSQPMATTITYEQCYRLGSQVKWSVSAPTPNPGATPPVTPAPSSSGNALYGNLSTCPPIDGCIARIFYWLFYAIPNLLLNVAGNFFNVIVALTLYSDLYDKATFVGNAWAIVRDFSNIFFILILLYIGIKVILGLGGTDVKKMIAHVIIMALLINFSMFMTKIVIDTSNILALIFYNKINVATTKDGKTIEPNYLSVLSKDRDKDISGGMMGYFDPTRILTQEFFDNFREKTYTFSIKGAALATGTGALVGNLIPIPGVGAGIGAVTGLVGYALSGFANSIPLAVSAGFIVLAGSIIIFATYCFFIAGISFLGRLIELWVLIIFSPFAFVSFTIPLLKNVEYIGWDAWLKRLLTVSFMAPIFMFFMYFIFMIIKSNIFISLLARPNPKEQLWMETIILMVIPALIILILLHQATKFAKKGAGALGEVLMKTAGIATGLVIGGGLGLAAKTGQTFLGEAGKRIFESKGLKDAEKGGSRFARSLRSFAGGDDGKGGMAGSSFDARKGIVGGGLKSLSAVTGLNLGADSKFLSSEAGGHMADLKRKDEKRKARAEGLKVSENEKEKQELNKAQEEHRTVSLKNEEDIREKDRDIKAAEAKVKRLKDVAIASEHMGKNADDSYKDPEHDNKQEEYRKAADEVNNLYAQRSYIKNGGFDKETGEYRTHNGKITQDEVVKANLAVEDADKALANAEKMLTKATLDETAAKKAETDALAEVVLAVTPEAITAAKERAAKATANAASATKNVTSATSHVSNSAQDYANKEAWANRSNTAALNGYGNSQNAYEDDLIPKAEHKLKKVNDERIEGHAYNLEKRAWWWNRLEVGKSAHEIRMGVKPEKERGGGHGVGLIEHAAIEALGQAFSSHGHDDKGSAPATGAKDAGHKT